MLYVTSDLHLGHKNILIHEKNTRGKRFYNIYDHDNTIIRNINSKVKKHDTLLITGDFAFGNKEMLKKYVQKINCEDIHILMGSHDRSYSALIEIGFSRVYRYPFIMYNLLFTHNPLYMPKGSRIINCHGHIHSKHYYFGKTYSSDEGYVSDRYHFNLCPENKIMDFYPISIDELLKYASYASD